MQQQTHHFYQKISRDEMNELKKQGNDVSYITSKK